MRNQKGWGVTPPPRKASRPRPALWPVLVIATLIMVMMAAPAFAAKGGNGKGGPNRAPSATLVVAPDPVSSGDLVSVSGCGYVDGKPVNVVVRTQHSTYFFPVAVSGSCVSFNWRPYDTGMQYWEAWQHVKGRKQTLMGSTTLEVR